MSGFNLRKFSENDAETNEKMLEPQREEFENKKPTSSTQKQLSDVREDDEDDVTTEEQLRAARLHDNTNTTIEARLDSHKPDEGLPQRTGNDEFSQMPINLLEEKNHQTKIKDYRRSGYMSAGDNVEFWDDYITSSDIEPAKSQLQNNVDRFKGLSDEDIMKNDGVKKMVMASLETADAMLYHIFRSASGRELTSKETLIISGINADKAKLLNQLLRG